MKTILTILFLLCYLFSEGQLSVARKLLLSQVVSQVGRDTFDTPGLNTWTCPSGVTEVTVFCISGGNPGYESFYNDPASGYGGGGGAFAEKTFTVISGTQYNLFVGSGGIGGTSGITLGSESWFWHEDSVFAAPPGLYDTWQGGQAVDCIGDVVYSGGDGAQSSFPSYSGGGGGAAGTTGNGGNASGINGGSSTSLYGGGGGGGLSSNGLGNTGNIYGGGGSGGYNDSGESAGGDGADGIVVISYGECLIDSITIEDVASVGTFQLAHSLISDGTYIYAGERINNSTPDSIARIIKYNSSTLSEIDAYEVGANRDVESMTYDGENNRIYTSQLYDNGTSTVVSILRINPSTMSLVDTTVFNSLLTGESFPIVNDGTYIYGATYQDPSVFFKIRISDMILIDTTHWNNGERAHAARIDTASGFMYVTDLPYSVATSPRFAKVNLSNLSFTEVSIGDYVRKSTDDFAMIDTGTEVYCYIGSEYVYTTPGSGNNGYGGVQVKTSDLSLTGISIKTTYAVGESGNFIYSTTIDGNVQVFNRTDLDCISTTDLISYYGNEFTALGGYGYITNFENYDKTKGKLIKISLLE